MTRPRTALLVSIIAIAIGCLGWIFWQMRSPSAAPAQAASTPGSVPASNAKDDLAPTSLYAHNILLRKGPDFRVYIRWISGVMERTRPQVTPSFDDPDSFVLQIRKGVVRANIGDLAHYLNVSSPSDAPLKNISVVPDGDQLKVHGTAHKVIPIPVEIEGQFSCTPDGRIQFHVARISALKIPLKGLLGGFHIELSDLVHTTNFPGIQVAGNDIFFDTTKVLPPPHIHGLLTSVTVKPPDIEAIYGNAPNDDAALAKWHNFLRLEGGTLDFGKLTMHNVDLTLIDASQDPWFDLDLVNYQAQIVNGTTRMTAQAGLEIFMPDVDEKAPAKVAQGITLEWLKNRNRAVPTDVEVAK
ncbi:MAG TPA: hypothetical protein VKH40_10825 [Alloacidobacterium sp.]|nr:hypothetical protein [Alloacidobacterium sp.]